MNKVLEASGLCQRKGDIFLSTLQACRGLIAEYKIDVKLTMISIENKCCHFLRVGSCNKMNHPVKMHVFHWRERAASPNLCISKLMRIFSLNNGQLNLMLNDESSCMEIKSESSDSSSEESESQASPENKFEVGSITSGGLDHSTVKLDLPNHNKFPLLNSLCKIFFCSMGINKLLSPTETVRRGNKLLNVY